MQEQLDMLLKSNWEKFAAWKRTPGARHVLRLAYVLTARYARRFETTGQTVSMKLIWEELRDQMVRIRANFARRGVELKQFEGFALNNVFTAYVARHIIEHRPEWDGLFELREVNRMRGRRRVLVIAERGMRSSTERTTKKGTEL